MASITDPVFLNALKKSSQLKKHVFNFIKDTSAIPLYTELLGAKHRSDSPNVIYPISEKVFIHINGKPKISDGYFDYIIIEPAQPDKSLMSLADRLFATDAAEIDPPKSIPDRIKLLDDYIKEKMQISKSFIPYDKLNIEKTKSLSVYEPDVSDFTYHFSRKRAGLGILDPFLTDPHLEDISIAGAGYVYVIHKIFGALKSSVQLENEQIDDVIISMADQFGKTVSHAKPVIDATLPEGSRINIVYGSDVSKRGTNATIRRFAAIPLSITQILSSKTFDYVEAAYMWMMLDSGMSVFINGETASGKTTSLMGLTAFIPSNKKIVTIEDTSEITLPHPNWIKEVTRDTGNPDSSVGMFDLLKAALRQRPDYIFVGEIRGAEANIAFQAMQTGHPVISTFHAANMGSLVQRITNTPMNIPKTNIENLNLAIFQGAVQTPDGKRVRRILSINEIVGFDTRSNNVSFIPIFSWDPGTDTKKFKGKGSSAHFIQKLLTKRGMSRKDESSLYDELSLRSKILQKMVEKKIFDFYVVYNAISRSRQIGIDAYYAELQRMQ